MMIAVECLTAPKPEIVRFVRDHWGRMGMGPTLREIAAAIHRSIPAVCDQVNWLVREGYLLRDRHPRSIAVVEGVRLSARRCTACGQVLGA